MPTYKELADRLEKFAANCCIPDDENTPPREAAAILRSLDAQRPTVDEVMKLALLWRDAYIYDSENQMLDKHWHSSEAEQDLRTAIEALAAPVAAQPTEQASKPLSDEPNMFWNHDDPESPYCGIGEFLNDEWCQRGIEVGDIRRVQRAIRLPDVMVRVTAVSDDGDIDYIVEPVGGIKERG